MNKGILFILCAIALTFIACGEDHLANKSSNELRQYVYALPDGSSEDITSLGPIGDLYVEQGQTIKFYAAYGFDQVVFTDEALQEYYSDLSWNIDGESYNLANFRYTPNRFGKIDGYLEAIDLYGDTMHNDFSIHVNTPNSITLLFPYDGYNQADPSGNQQLPLRWTVQGTDPWETTTCQVFISDNADSVWDNILGTANCDSEASINGSLLGELDPAVADSLAQDSSFTLYWGVKLITKSESGHTYQNQSEIFHFSTKILNDSSTLKIPVIHSRYRDDALLNSDVYLISSNNDTLQKLSFSDKYYTASTKVKAQSRLKILVKENFRTEYAAESIVVDIPSHTVLTLDTIKLIDNEAPQLSPFLETISPADSVQFLVYDDGSGISHSKLTVVVDGDTISSNYRAPMLLFKTKCRLNCKVEILGEDNAHNSLPQVYWFIENKSSYYSITGPYTKEDF